MQRADLADALTASLRALLESSMEKLHGEALAAAESAFLADEPGALPLDANLRWSLAQVLGEDEDPLA